MAEHDLLQVFYQNVCSGDGVIRVDGELAGCEGDGLSHLGGHKHADCSQELQARLLHPEPFEVGVQKMYRQGEHLLLAELLLAHLCQTAGGEEERGSDFLLSLFLRVSNLKHPHGEDPPHEGLDVRLLGGAPGVQARLLLLQGSKVHEDSEVSGNGWIGSRSNYHHRPLLRSIFRL